MRGGRSSSCIIPWTLPGRYQAQARLTRWQIESTLVESQVDAVFSGHEHLFARMKPQHGVQYFISSAAGSLRKGDARQVPTLARSFDDDFHFVLVEIDGDAMYVQAISRVLAGRWTPPSSRSGRASPPRARLARTDFAYLIFEHLHPGVDVLPVALREASCPLPSQEQPPRASPVVGRGRTEGTPAGNPLRYRQRRQRRQPGERRAGSAD